VFACRCYVKEVIMEKIKNIATIVLFTAIIFCFSIANIIVPDAGISFSERRSLKQFPLFSVRDVLSGDFFSNFEKYALDQFVLRDRFRSIKAFMNFNVFKQKDYNGIYIINGNISRIDYPLNEKAVMYAADKISSIYTRYLSNISAAYAVIPDKNYFLARDNGYLCMDYDIMLGILAENIRGVKYINIFGTLSADDYYRTDIHWRQERIIQTADKLLEELGTGVKASDVSYTVKRLYPFYGAYYGQAAVATEPDTLVYLTNDNIEKARVFDHYYSEYGSIYEPEKFTGVDPYEVFLAGQKPVVTVENPNSETNRGLLLFKDSFGNSIAPLLLAGYSRITLIDLRLVSSDALGDLIDFSEYHDALFLYCTQTLNNGYMLK